MELLQSHVALVALWTVATLASIWVLGPLLLFLSPLRTFETEVREAPREAEPRGHDPDYERQFAELRVRGFQPVGKTVESAHFFTPMHWRWVSRGTRWLASSDRKVYVGISRLGDHPQRLSAETIFEGGGVLVTSTAPSGLDDQFAERYRRIEVSYAGPDEFIAEHGQNVSNFSREVGLRAKAATLAEVAAELAILTKPYVVRQRLAKLYLPAAVFLLPLWSLLPMLGRPHVPPWLPPAGLCVSAALFALIRLTALPEFRRVYRWSAMAGLMIFALLLPMLLGLKPPHK